ncbi:MAG: hypothetical protein EHM47_08220 [Ignavibacteriales bacterium]|nr:MAG: hypothetical protein EHM47_08220 [Ignavibacteriales bacterium]
MKRVNLPALFFTVLFLTAFNNSSAQELYFCEGVDDDGYAINDASTFTVSESGGYLYFLVRMGRGRDIDCNEVLFDIYKVDSRGKETFDNTIYQDVEPEWTWFWKQVTFYDRGTYKVYVYDEDSQLITSGKVKINYR